MTEFRKASAAVETVEKLIGELQGDVKLAEQGELPAESHARWTEVEKQFNELSPVAEKMQRRCDARSELEKLKEELRALLPPCSPEECMKKAQELVDGQVSGFESVQEILSKALDLEATATYGVKMAEKVRELLLRLAKARSCFEALRPQLEPLVRQLDHRAAASEAERHRQRQAEEEAKEREAQEAARKPLEELLSDNQRKMDAQRAMEEAAQLKREEELRQEQEKEAARLAAEDALLRMEKESDVKISKLGANAACAEALSSMLAASMGVYRGIIEGLENMVTSIAAEPADVRLRLIRIRNEGFQERLGRQPGVWLFLRALGFQAMSREDLPTDMVAMLNLSSSPPQERFLLLQEPDMMNAYEEWTQWHKRLLAEFTGKEL